MATVEIVQEHRVVLHGISWKTYECLLWDHADRSAPRFTYDRGELEIVTLLPRHERYKRAIESLVLAVAEELDIDLYSLGSTTFRREDLERGLEPDSCFYLEHHADVDLKDRIDPGVDPPPDLVIEITSPAVPKVPIYAQMGVPEVWLYDGGRMRFLLLGGDEYTESAESRALPGVTADALTEILEEGKGLANVAWMRRVREWARAGLAIREAPGGDS